MFNSLLFYLWLSCNIIGVIELVWEIRKVSTLHELTLLQGYTNFNVRPQNVLMFLSNTPFKLVYPIPMGMLMRLVGEPL
jgi:hypothetical protein